MRSTYSDINLHVWGEFLLSYLEAGTLIPTDRFQQSELLADRQPEAAGNRLVGPHGIRALLAALFSTNSQECEIWANCQESVLIETLEPLQWIPV